MRGSNADQCLDYQPAVIGDGLFSRIGRTHGPVPPRAARGLAAYFPDGHRPLAPINGGAQVIRNVRQSRADIFAELEWSTINNFSNGNTSYQTSSPWGPAIFFSNVGVGVTGAAAHQLLLPPFATIGGHKNPDGYSILLVFQTGHYDDRPRVVLAAGNFFGQHVLEILWDESIQRLTIRTGFATGQPFNFEQDHLFDLPASAIDSDGWVHVVIRLRSGLGQFFVAGQIEVDAKGRFSQLTNTNLTSADLNIINTLVVGANWEQKDGLSFLGPIAQFALFLKWIEGPGIDLWFDDPWLFFKTEPDFDIFPAVFRETCIEASPGAHDRVIGTPAAHDRVVATAAGHDRVASTPGGHLRVLASPGGHDRVSATPGVCGDE